MSASITLARLVSTGRIKHIKEVEKKQGEKFICLECKNELVPVKGIAEKKAIHFRHLVDTSCSGGRDTALHDYAVQILLENDSISLTKSLHIPYSGPRKEVYIFGKRSDVTVKFEGEDVHFEVVVTHDLDEEKMVLYKTNKSKCVRIDLTETSLLSAMPETIKEVVLKDVKVKKLIYWNDEIEKEKDGEAFSLIDLILGGIALTTIFVVVKKLFKPKRKLFRR